MDRDINRQDPAMQGTSNMDVDTGPDIRRSMIMGRDLGVTTAHPEMVENMAVTRLEKVEPFGSDLVHWGSIWGGFFTYLALVSILSAIAVSIGALSVAPSAPPDAGVTAGTIGVTVGVIMLVSTFVGALLAGWTSNIRSRWPAVVNGLIYASLVLTAPMLFTLFLGALTTSATAGAVAGVQAQQGGVNMPGGLGVDARTLDMIAQNVGWYSLGGVLLLAVGALGYILGMRAHLNDLGLVRHRDRDVVRT